MSDQTERDHWTLRLLNPVASLVERRLARCSRDERAAAVISIVSEVYLRLEPDATPETVQELARTEVRRFEAEGKRIKRRSHKTHGIQGLAVDEGSERKRVYRHALWAYLDSLLTHVSEQERFAIEAFAADDLPDVDIGSILGWSPEKVRQVRCRVKRRLRELVRAGEVPGPPQPD